MRLSFSTGKDTLDIIRALQRFCEEDSQSTVVTDSIYFLYQIEVLLKSGFKFALIDPEGQQFIIGKGEVPDEPTED
jgi:hypothetical protein